MTVSGMLVGGITMVVWGGLLLLFGLRLLDAHVAALGWPSSLGALFSISAMFPAMLAMYGCRRPGWNTAVMTFMAVSVVAGVLAANIVAAAVILWAAHPPAATGTGGLITVGLAGLVLTLPVAWGAMTLLDRRLASDLPWRAWLKNEHFRASSLLGLIFGLAVAFLDDLAAISLEAWLEAVYPAAQGLNHGGSGVGTMIVLFCLAAGPTDLRSMLKTFLAALIVIEAAIAAQITMALLMITLQSDSTWLALSDILLIAPVLVGAFLLIAHRPGGWEAGASETPQEEATP